jgi:hypothetical protein
MAFRVKSLRLLWLLATVLLLVVALLANQDVDKDLDLVMIWGMTVLGFPSSLLVYLIMGWLSILFLAVQLEYLPIWAVAVIWWLPAFLAGYLQWFTIVPKVLKLAKPKRK